LTLNSFSKINNENYFNFSVNPILMLTTKSKYLLDNTVNIFNDFNLDHEKVCTVNQIHSNKIIFVKNPGNFGEADGMITNIKYTTILSIQTADCIPMFIFDEFSGLIGLIHAGWKGIVKEIHINAILNFVKLGSIFPNIKIFLGPFIESCCYEIKSDIFDHFNKKYLLSKGKKTYLDLFNLVIDDLIKIGIDKNKISYSNICTYDNNDCCSFRRDKKKSDRMYSFISYI